MRKLLPVLTGLTLVVSIIVMTQSGASAINNKRGDFDFDKLKDVPFWREPAKKNISQSEAENLIVKFKKSPTDQRVEVIEENKAELGERIDGTSSYVVEPDKNQSLSKLEKALEDEKIIEFVELDMPVQAQGQVEPWGFVTVNAQAAQSNGGVDGSGQVVAVVDTGVDYLHEDLSNNIWSNGGETPGDGIDNDANGYIDDVRGWDFVDEYFVTPVEDNNPMDDAGHGTHVAGTIAAEDNGVGVVGVANGANIMPVKVLDSSGSGLFSTISNGIIYATDNGADVINLSLGGQYASRTMREAVNYATSNGVIVVAAAGNEYGFNLYGSYPAQYENVISVGALEQNPLQKTWWSNWGKVDIVAPGDQILSTIPDDAYTKYSGTSMAAPHVSAVAALTKEKYPTFNSTQVRQVIEKSSTEIGRDSNDVVNGNGVLNADEAVTGSLESISLITSKRRIIADNNGFQQGQSTITATVLDASGDPVSGEEISFSTDQGDLSSVSVNTDVNGQATTNLTADDVEGFANVTAISDNYGSSSIEVILFNDKVYIESVRPLKDEADVDSEDFSSYNSTFGQGEKINFETILYPKPYLTLDDTSQANKKVNLSYQVKDKNGADVEGFSGGENNIAVDWLNYYMIQESIPDELTSGYYTMEVTVTDRESNKTDNASTKFKVGKPTAQVLLLPEATNFALSVDPYTLDNEAWVESSQFQKITEALDNNGTTYDIWPHFYLTPSYSDLKKYPIVINTSAGLQSTDILSDYIENGGNVLISGNTDFFGAVSRSATSSYTGWCGGGSVSSYINPLGFNCVGIVTNPESVSSVDAGIYEGLSFDIDAYNLSGDGRLNQLWADEISPRAGSVSELEYAAGTNSPAIATVSRDDGNSKIIANGFGIEGINSNTGDSTLEDYLDASLSYLKPVGVTVSRVGSKTVTKGTSKRINIYGSGFEIGGTTVVKAGSTKLSSVKVLSRDHLVATVPKTMSAGKKNISVTNPFGQTGTKTNAITVVYPAPKIKSISPKKLSNDRSRVITIKGSNFRKGINVKIGKKSATNVSVKSSGKLTARFSGGIKPGKYTVSVINSDGKKATKKSIVIQYGFKYDLRFGSNDPAVKQLQIRLQKAGYYPANASPSDYFGYYTRSSLIKYQTAKNLQSTGVLDNATRNYLNTH